MVADAAGGDGESAQREGGRLSRSVSRRSCQQWCPRTPSRGSAERVRRITRRPSLDDTSLAASLAHPPSLLILDITHHSILLAASLAASLARSLVRPIDVTRSFSQRSGFLWSVRDSPCMFHAFPHLDDHGSLLRCTCVHFAGATFQLCNVDDDRQVPFPPQPSHQLCESTCLTPTPPPIAPLVSAFAFCPCFFAFLDLLSAPPTRRNWMTPMGWPARERMRRRQGSRQHVSKSTAITDARQSLRKQSAS